MDLFGKDSDSSTRTFQQVVFGHPLTTKSLFIDTSWKVLVYKPTWVLRFHVNLFPWLTPTPVDPHGPRAPAQSHGGPGARPWPMGRAERHPTALHVTPGMCVSSAFFPSTSPKKETALAREEREERNTGP